MTEPEVKEWLEDAAGKAGLSIKSVGMETAVGNDGQPTEALVVRVYPSRYAVYDPKCVVLQSATGWPKNELTVDKLRQHWNGMVAEMWVKALQDRFLADNPRQGVA